MGSVSKVFYKKLAAMISTKRGHTYQKETYINSLAGFVKDSLLAFLDQGSVQSERPDQSIIIYAEESLATG